MKKTLLIFLLLFLFYSCVSYQSGGISSDLVSPNSVYTDIAIGSANSNRFLGLGGMRKDALLFEAKRSMMTSRPLRQNEAYANITYDWKRTFAFFIDRTKVTVTADVVTILENPIEDRYSENYKSAIFLKNPTIDSAFSIGKDVITSRIFYGRIIESKQKHRSKVSYRNKKGEYKTRTIHHEFLYTLKGQWKDFQVGDSIEYYTPYETRPIEALIIGIGLRRMMVRTLEGNVEQPYYKDIRFEK